MTATNRTLDRADDRTTELGVLLLAPLERRLALVGEDVPTVDALFAGLSK
jgi:hypothetical protein